MYKKVSYPEKECAYCKEFFKPNRKDKIYCRRTCQKQASRKRRPGWKEKQLKALLEFKKDYYPYKHKIKKGYCSRCGFIPEHPCQMDIHHIDHDHQNNSPDNLEVLCSNCHRLHHFGSPVS